MNRPRLPSSLHKRKRLGRRRQSVQSWEEASSQRNGRMRDKIKEHRAPPQRNCLSGRHLIRRCLFCLKRQPFLLSSIMHPPSSLYTTQPIHTQPPSERPSPLSLPPPLRLRPRRFRQLVLFIFHHFRNGERKDKTSLRDREGGRGTEGGGRDGGGFLV